MSPTPSPKKEPEFKKDPCSLCGGRVPVEPPNEKCRTHILPAEAKGGMVPGPVANVSTGEGGEENVVLDPAAILRE